MIESSKSRKDFFLIMFINQNLKEYLGKSNE